MTKKKLRKKSPTQLELLIQFFTNNPNRDIPHPEVVDWATSKWKKLTGKVFRDPDRGIRQLHQQGYLIKIAKGVYKYNPSIAQKRKVENFSVAQKQHILKRDNYRCVICGRGKQEGVELHIDHIKSKDFGGKAAIENGQTLCSQHNFIKKNMRHTETGKRMFIRLYELAKKERNNTLKNFCTDILRLYDKYEINGHIEWKE